MAITPVFTCGWECGTLVTGSTNGEHWIVTTSLTTATISTSTVRSGARALRINTTAAGCTTRTPVLTSSTRWIGRVYIRFAALPSADNDLVSTAAANGPVVRFKQSDSKIYAGVTTTLGASGVAVTTGVWYRIDFDFNISAGGNDVCDVQVGGTACGQAHRH